MIVKMKHLDLICLKAERETTLEKLRNLGAIHLNLAGVAGAEIAAADTEVINAEKAVQLILKARGKTPIEDVNVHERAVAEVLAIHTDRSTLAAERDRLEKLIRIYEPYGDFDPELARKVLSAGVELKEVLPPELPEMRLSKLQEKLARVNNRIRIDNDRLAGCDEHSILKKFPQLQERAEFARAKAIVEEHGEIAVISGWIPEKYLRRLDDVMNGGRDLFEMAKKPAWGILVRDPDDAEIPPTLVEPPKCFKAMKALFNGLGIAPAYTEADVSVPFMCYFALFFAMLVGDGAYGSIFLAATLYFRKRLPRSWFTLLSVFSSATVAWGILSNTWFGAQIPWCADWPTVKWLADPSYHNMMLLCFTIGVSHLMLARIWNGICKLNDTTCVAEFGWAGVLLFMYLVTNSIVGIFSGIPNWGYWVFAISLVCVFGFTVKPSELKTRGAELGMLPLNIMSALGDIISYVRLFAVGLASVKVAENFNSMATGLVAGDKAWYLKAGFALVMVAILVVGHALNLAMAGLSILVHAVRLNTLEFSNHKGVSWAGYAFKAFKSTTNN